MYCQLPPGETDFVCLGHVDLRQSLATVERDIVVQRECHVIVIAIADDPSSNSSYWSR